MADLVSASDINTFLTNVAWVIHSTYHTVIKASPGAAIFGQDMLVDIPFLADWNKIGEFSILNVKINHAMTGTTMLVIKYRYGKMVSSTNQKVIMNVILGLSHQFI
jgi:hypothetical protein